MFCFKICRATSSSNQCKFSDAITPTSLSKSLNWTWFYLKFGYFWSLKLKLLLRVSMALFILYLVCFHLICRSLFLSIFVLYSLLECIVLVLSPPVSFMSLYYCPTSSALLSLFPLLPFLFLGSSFSFPLISAIAVNSYIWNRVGTSYSCDFTLK